MNNLLHNIIREEIDNLTKINISAIDRTKILKRIIREELLKEKSGVAGWRWSIYGTDTLRQGFVNRKAERNGAVLGFPLIGRAQRGSKGAPAEMLRRDAIGWLTQNKELGPTGKYNKKTYMYVLSNPIKLTKRAVKFHVWIFDKNIFNSVWNKIKPIIQDKQSDVYFRNQKFVTDLDNVTIHTPEQAEGWKRQLIALTKEFEEYFERDQDLKDDLFHLGNTKPKKIRGDVSLKATKPFVITVDDKGFDVNTDSKLESPWMVNGEVLVKYSPDGMNLQIFPIKGKGGVRSIEDEDEDITGEWTGTFTGDYDKTTHTPTVGVVDVHIDRSRDPWFAQFTGEIIGTRKGPWERPRFTFEWIKGHVEYYDTDFEPHRYGVFTGTFDKKGYRPNTGKAQGVKVTYFEGNEAPSNYLYVGDVQNRKPVGEGEWHNKEVNNLIFKGKGPWKSREGIEYYPEDKDGIYEQGVWKNDKQFNVIQYNAYDQKRGEYKDGGEFEGVTVSSMTLDKDAKSPSVEKIKKALLRMEETESIPADDALLNRFKESVANKPDTVDKITLNFVKGIKYSWKKRIAYDEDIEATQGQITKKFTDTLWKVVNLPAEANESTQRYSNVKDIILQEYKKIMREQWSEKSSKAVDTGVRNKPEEEGGENEEEEEVEGGGEGEGEKLNIKK